MKTVLLCLLTFISSTIFAQSKTDEPQIQRLVDELVMAYNTHDFTTLKTNSTDDVSWVNIVGMWWKGQQEVVGAHSAVFNTIFKGVKFEKKQVVLRPIAEGVMLVNLIIHVGEFFPPDGVDHGTNRQKAADDILTLIYVKKANKWLLTAGQNTVIDSNAVPPKK